MNERTSCSKLRTSANQHGKYHRLGVRYGSRQGVALIFVLIVIAMLTLCAYTFTDLMLAEKEAATLHAQRIQARTIVDSGVDQLRYFLELPELDRRELGGTFENPDWFQSVLVRDGLVPEARGRFCVIAPMLDNAGYFGGVRFGLENESARLNLNALNLEIEEEEEEEAEEGDEDTGDATPAGGTTPATGGGTGPATGGGASPPTAGAANNGDTGAEEDGTAEEGEEELVVDTSGRALLMKLPGMTEIIADSILDWLDEDDEPREFGAEVDYYSGLSPPYAPKNGPIETVEELLMVQGVTPDLLFGRDVNRNGMIDMHEQNLPMQVDTTADDGSLDRGWSALLTLYSMEKNVDADGNPRIDLNGDDLQTLFADLSEALNESWATFIIAYRQNGPDTGTSEAEPATNQPLDYTRPGRFPITQVLDLVGVRTRARLADDEGSVILESPFADDILSMGSYLPELMDKCTVNAEPMIPGRVNINQAPLAVLLSVPGMTEEIADAIISERDIVDDGVDQNLQHETWLLTRAVVTLDQMKTLMPYVTAGGDVFRAQVVGYFDQGAVSARAEVIVDATLAYPRILFWRDISHLGRGFALETLGVQSF